ncbi:sensor histidine kinase [[Muricauda] lutisoli]|uniref:histidine kinase n=1 Tax=[Muricauda] lutisoli TaxID=2816035 RepID=A0ABS3EWG5_9FLAO|nr:ATP-binding protein [[Muricauda] lutisoli]MBO0330590.1 sensor histidine kinase [[Muricauda] lutisoli]
MAIKLKKSYKFALRSSLVITILITAVFVGFHMDADHLDWPHTLLFTLICFAICFAIIQIRVERFIYRRIKRIYDDVSLLESSSFSSKPVTTDMKTLVEEIEKFAEGKKIEIDTLKIREEYRKDFLGNVSHELKTPLFTVQGYILTLLDGAMKDKKLRKKYLQRANKGVERLIYIVKDLDLITKLEAGELKLEREDFDIIELIQNTFDLLEMKAARKEISLTFDMEYTEPIYVNGDKDKIQQVISNLLVNSIKYGLPKGTTEVSVENLIKNKVIVRVTDNGGGIPKQHIPRLFERFYRVDQSGSRTEGGSGLGLSIVKHIVEAHGEKIYVESEVDVGSEFSFTLEKAANPPVSEKTSNKEEKSTIESN